MAIENDVAASRRANGVRGASVVKIVVAVMTGVLLYSGAALMGAVAYANESIISLQGGVFEGRLPDHVSQQDERSVVRDYATFDRGRRGYARVQSAELRMGDRRGWVSSSARQVAIGALGTRMTGMERIDNGRQTIRGYDMRYYVFTANVTYGPMSCVSFAGDFRDMALTGVICTEMGVITNAADAIDVINWIEVEGRF